jgi:hypothetical protein
VVAASSHNGGQAVAKRALESVERGEHHPALAGVMTVLEHVTRHRPRVHHVRPSDIGVNPEWATDV